ncbi:MAG TPA: gamma-glutamyltransferase [Verrucomicrobiae bacterium]|nr:gamma-glutamyltransferase [Verrucomicrobiae bacterium]
MKHVLLAAVVMLTVVDCFGYKDRGRSMVITTGGIVASEHPLASQAAVQILANGGNAIDAAIAANACMSVLSPMQCGMGGDLFAIVYEAKTGQLHGLNASGWSPAALDAKYLRDRGHKIVPTNGVHSITVPGCVSGWEHLQKKFARKKLSELLAPAIDLAENGFPVPEIIGGYWTSSNDVKRLSEEPSSRAVFLPNGSWPKVGEVFRNPDMAWSLRQVAKSGARAFYKGPITKRLLEYLRSKAGLFDEEDFSKYSAEWVKPISTTYRGWTVYEIPPNGQGIAALSMLNLMERFPLKDWGHNSPNALHTMIEAKKLAYADMLAYVGDPRFRKVPASQMLSKDYAAKRAKLIDAEKANCNIDAGRGFDPGPDTTYLCVVDKEGNMVSLIQSIYFSFGSALVAPGTGFALHNRGALFNLEEGHPNVLAGHKRPVHTIIPAFMEKGDTKIAFGIMGGWNQSQAHAQFVANVVDFGMNIQKALEAPRFTKITFEGCDVKLEGRVPAATIEVLKQRGHQLNVGDPYQSDMGCGQAVLRDFATKVNFGASDPRKDGAAIPEPPRVGRK